MAINYFHANSPNVLLRSFLLAQKRTKKGSQSLGPALRDCPALLETTGSLKTRCAQTGQTPFSVVSVVLGGVKWHLLDTYIIFICILIQDIAVSS